MGKTARVDNKGRVTLGHLADDITSYEIKERPGRVLVLFPKVEVPLKEAESVFVLSDEERDRFANSLTSYEPNEYLKSAADDYFKIGRAHV